MNLPEYNNLQVRIFKKFNILEIVDDIEFRKICSLISSIRGMELCEAEAIAMELVGVEMERYCK